MAKIKVKGKLLDHIGLALYGRFEKAISELIANSYDANASEVFVYLDESVQKIEIVDNGEGMTKEEIENKYLLLGSDHRRKEVRKSTRKPIGAKGIGKLAGIGIATTMKIITQKEGIESSFVISREELEDIDDISEINIEIVENSNRKTFELKGSGTKVILTDFLEHVEFETPEGLSEYLSEEFWVKAGFNIFVNDEQVPLIPEVVGDKLLIEMSDGYCKIEGEYTGKLDTYEIDIEIENDDYKILGEITGELTLKRFFSYFPDPGIISITRNRKIHEPSLFNIFDKPHKFYVIQTCRGYLRADCFDPDKPTSRIDELGIQTGRSGYTDTNPKYHPYRKFVNELLLKLAKKLESIWNKERKEQLKKNKQTQKKRFKTQVLKREDQVINILIESLKHSEDPEMSERYFKLAMEVLGKSDSSTEFKEYFIKSPDKFEPLIKSYQDIFAQRIPDLKDDIDEFKRLINDSKTSETDMQTFLKDKVWFFGLDYLEHIPQPEGGFERFDFLLKRFNQIYDIIEIKGPNDKIFVRIAASKPNDFRMTKNLNRAIVQITEYFNFWEAGGRSLLQLYKKLGEFDNPRGIIVIGKREFLDTDMKIKNFKTLSDRLHNIELLTYDDLLDRANNIIDFLNRFFKKISTEDEE